MKHASEIPTMKILGPQTHPSGIPLIQKSFDKEL